MREIVVRVAGIADAPLAAELLCAMDRHYRPDAKLPMPANYERMVAETISGREGTRFLLCLSAEGRPLGIGCFAVLRPGRDVTGLVFVKDLFVTEEARGQGVGTALMRFLARFCLAHGIGRIDLGTDTGNEGARRLYAALGGVVAGKVSYSFWSEALKQLAAEES